jgi:aminoglycoside phosphotransferase (APT) family kinase protein
MALLNVLDPVATEAELTKWFAGKLPGATDLKITDLEIPQSAGMSMTSVLFKVSYREGGAGRELDLAARVAPANPDAGSFIDTDLRREFRLLQTLGQHSDVAIPTARWLEEDADVIGSAFMIVGRAFGRVPPDDPPYTVGGWVLELPPEQRGKLYENALQQLERLHAVDWRRLGIQEILDKPEFGPPGIDQQIGHWENFYHWASEGQASPTIDSGFAWIKANRPRDEEVVLNWGDPRIGNIIYGDDLSVQAVLDWEMAALASPELDLGWFVFFVRYYSEGVGIPIPEGMPTRAQLVARYRELTGREVKHIDYYEAFAALRLSILFLRIAHVMIAGGLLPSDSPMGLNNPASQILARLLNLPAPAGEAVNFVGKR